MTHEVHLLQSKEIKAKINAKILKISISQDNAPDGKEEIQLLGLAHHARTDNTKTCVPSVFEVMYELYDQVSRVSLPAV